MASHKAKWLTIVMKVLKLPFLMHKLSKNVPTKYIKIRSTQDEHCLYTSSKSQVNISPIGKHPLEKLAPQKLLRQHCHAGRRDLDHYELDQSWSVFCDILSSIFWSRERERGGKNPGESRWNWIYKTKGWRSFINTYINAYVAWGRD